MSDATERTRRIHEQVLRTNRNRGVDVLVNKLDFLWFFERIEEAERENERLRKALEEIERADAKTPVLTLNRIARQALAGTGGEA